MGTRVLVVEDDALAAAFMVDTLTRLGHTAYEANSGSEAMEMLRADGTFELVMTDLHMGRMSGYDLAGQVRLMHPSLPVILVAADGHATADHDCRMPVLLKPSTRHQLGQVVRDASFAVVH